MKHKLTRRLIVSFSLILVSFALLVGVMFTCLFAEHSAQIYAEDLQAHAVSIADAVTQDHGVGIPPEDLPHIFGRFYRQHAVGHPNGTGLGLSIAREIALRHHVDMTCDSVPGAGTRFTLTVEVILQSGLRSN